MSQHSAHNFLTRLMEEPYFRHQFMDMSSADEVMEAARDAGYEFTQEEMKTVLQQDKAVRNFDDATLDEIASGGAAEWIGGIGSGVAAGVGAGAAAAACV